MIRDMMPRFDLYQPTRLDDALALLDRFGKDGWRLAGGNDSLGWFKERTKRPRAVIDLAGIDDLSGVRQTADGLDVGALTTLAAIERHPLIRSQFRLLAEAAATVASPQIRNTGTIGGNILQHARCWYYRSGQPCFRAGGHECFADYPESINREHALFDAGRCVAVNPSDVAPALAALDAQMVIRSSKGERIVGSEAFFVGPRTDVTSLNCLKPDEILVTIRLPRAWAGAAFYFEKVADRQVWDFPLVNVAAAIEVADGVIRRANIVCGAVAATPKRLPAVEQAIKGLALGEDAAARAAEAAVGGASPLTYNGYKIPLMANLVRRAVRQASA
jgi:xanthine dehydrogenase YagS FAD-binding subunit